MREGYLNLSSTLQRNNGFIYIMENKGFTLIELLIVIAIIGILVGIALPSYQAHVRKANRIDIQLEMVEKSLVAERHYARQGEYPASDLEKIVSSYKFNYTKAGSAFTISAAPQGGQLSDECGAMTLNQTGLVTVKGGSVLDNDIKQCW